MQIDAGVSIYTVSPPPPLLPLLYNIATVSFQLVSTLTLKSMVVIANERSMKIIKNVGDFITFKGSQDDEDTHIKHVLKQFNLHICNYKLYKGKVTSIKRFELPVNQDNDLIICSNCNLILILLKPNIPHSFFTKKDDKNNLDYKTFCSIKSLNCDDVLKKFDNINLWRQIKKEENCYYKLYCPKCVNGPLGWFDQDAKKVFIPLGHKNIFLKKWNIPKILLHHRIGLKKSKYCKNTKKCIKNV